MIHSEAVCFGSRLFIIIFKCLTKKNYMGKTSRCKATEKYVVTVAVGINHIGLMNDKCQIMQYVEVIQSQNESERGWEILIQN